jgi:hypothetical protein
VQRTPVTTQRLIRSLPAIVALCVGILDAEARASSGLDPTLLEVVPGELEERIETLVHRWFAALGDPSVEANTLNDFLTEAPFELILDGEVLHDRDALLAWVSNLRATYPQIEYRFDSIRIQAEGQDRYRVRFEFDRHALDEAGLPHVARREHTWIVESDVITTPVILRMEERPLLFFPGTGPQVVCY